jgi:hypothetical protein
MYCRTLVMSTVWNTSGNTCPGLEWNSAEGSLSFQVNYMWLCWSPITSLVCDCPSVQLSPSAHDITLPRMVKCFLYVIMRYTSSAVNILVQTETQKLERVHCPLFNLFLFRACIFFVKTISRSWTIYTSWANFIRKFISDILHVCTYVCMYFCMWVWIHGWIVNMLHPNVRTLGRILFIFRIQEFIHLAFVPGEYEHSNSINMGPSNRPPPKKITKYKIAICKQQL